ncbi:Ras-related protein Rab-39A [Cryptotermes secundus]|uniref:Ras-related protein Rab-39A n=1 Tax=Cryptotermes secundus TaxID=105785 RepID=A0A2J7QPZ8_9NEOP|nr:Ras-related protein Rab-39A [Cryptotermes secundus]
MNAQGSIAGMGKTFPLLHMPRLALGSCSGEAFMLTVLGVLEKCYIHGSVILHILAGKMIRHYTAHHLITGIVGQSLQAYVGCLSITKSYYRNSVGALLVYDITNRSSFEHIPLWMMEARRHIEPHRPVFALVGCKLDLVSSSGRREVTKEEAREFAEHNGLHHVETSAKTGANVEEAFNAVTQEVYSRIQTGEYKIEDGWDGIKTGFQRPGGLDFNLVEAEPAKSTCC